MASSCLRLMVSVCGLNVQGGGITLPRISKYSLLTARVNLRRARVKIDGFRCSVCKHCLPF
jgi:hypothetical protein